MPNRRAFLAGLLAAQSYALPSWADVGSPNFISAAKRLDGTYALFGLSERGIPLFEIPLPGRGHAAAAHPNQPHVVAFARRPGTFALAIDCMTGKEMTRLTAPKGRHFYGHGVFSADGARLYTTENDYENAEGVIGVWDVQNGFRRIGEFSSGGVGPHEMRLMPNGGSLVVANGGLETHPASGRTKLNIPTMQPSLSYLSLDGALLEQVEAPQDMRRSSMRHLAVRADGLVAIGCQWQGPKGAAQLIYTHMRGEKLRGRLPLTMSADLHGYIGSIAFSDDGTTIAATSPRGNQVLLLDVESSDIQSIAQSDVSGVAPAPFGLALTSGEGHLMRARAGQVSTLHRAAVQWDNHLVAI